MSKEENIFDTIQRRMIINEMFSAFEKKKCPVSEVKLVDCELSKVTVEIITKDGNKIIVSEGEKKYTWKLNALNMGEVFGNEIYDVAGSYEGEVAKNTR